MPVFLLKKKKSQLNPTTISKCITLSKLLNFFTYKTEKKLSINRAVVMRIRGHSRNKIVHPYVQHMGDTHEISPPYPTHCLPASSLQLSTFVYPPCVSSIQSKAISSWSPQVTNDVILLYFVFLALF